MGFPQFQEIFFYLFVKGVQFLLCVIDICSEYDWVVPLKDKKCIKITNTSQKLLFQSDHCVAESKGRKTNKI